MNAEIIAVGSEMLTPQRVDTNSLYLTEELNNLGVEVAFWTIGLMALGVASGNNLKNVMNGPVIAIFLSLALNFSGADKLVPGFVLKPWIWDAEKAAGWPVVAYWALVAWANW